MKQSRTHQAAARKQMHEFSGQVAFARRGPCGLQIAAGLRANHQQFELARRRQIEAFAHEDLAAIGRDEDGAFIGLIDLLVLEIRPCRRA